FAADFVAVRDLPLTAVFAAVFAAAFVGALAAGFVASLVGAFFVVATAGPRVGALVGLEEAGPRHVRVPLRSGHAGVSKELLYRADVCSPFQQVRRERVSQRMRRDTTPRQGTSPISFHKRTDIAGTERPSLPVEEQGRGALGSHPGATLPDPGRQRLDGVLRQRHLTLL